MLDQREAAAPGQGRDGGNCKSRECADYTDACRSPQYLTDQIEAIRTEQNAAATDVAAGIREIEIARDRAARSISASGRRHFRNLAGDHTRWIMARLGIHRHGTMTIKQLRRALDIYTRLADATIQVHECEAAMMDAWATPLSPEWQAWERQLWERMRAKSKAAKLRRGWPWV